jgi:hypothetical protein
LGWVFQEENIRAAELGADRATVAALPLGSFVSWNRLTGATLTGQVF